MPNLSIHEPLHGFMGMLKSERALGWIASEIFRIATCGCSAVGE